MRGVVTCPEYLAAFAGAEILKAGGNAIDAAIATAFAQGVVGPKFSGLGGLGVMTVANAALSTSGCIRFWGTAGSKARADEFASDLVTDPETGRITVRDYRNSVGYRAVLVPGFVRGMAQGFVQYGSGRVSWGAILAPAILLAREGFAVDEYLYSFWRADHRVGDAAPPYTMLTATPACAAIYTRHGDVYHPGERLVQEDYARTLERLVAGGPEEFYEGEVGTRIAADMDRHGGLFTADDLRRYRPLSGEPLRGSYHGYDLLSDPPPGSGTLIIEALNLADACGLASLKWNSGPYLDVLARVFRRVFDDRLRYMADPRYVDVPFGRLTSAEHARTVAEHLMEAPLRNAGGLPHEGTTHVSVIDGDGNAAAITHTVSNSSGVVTPGLGFMFNNDMQSFDPTPGRINSIAPGKSPVNGGAPTIVVKNGQPVLAIGSPAGPRKVTAVVQVLLSVIDFGLDIEQALAAERIHQELGPLMTERTFPQDLAGELERGGHTVQETGYTARVAAAYRDIETGRFVGASDPRGGRGKAIVE